MTLAATSQEAYSKIIPKLPDSRKTVWECLLRHPEGMTNKELAVELKKDPNQITGRIFELRNLGLVKFYMKRRDRYTTYMAEVWVALPQSQQIAFW